MTQSATEQTPYAGLLPDTVLDAVEGRGLHLSGSILALNSYENRVYQLGLEDGGFVVTKFYRPGRWSDAQILEEHQFAAELTELEIPVVAPMSDEQGQTLHHHQGFRFAVYRRAGGHWPELEDPDTQYRLGQLLGRIHAVGAVRPFKARNTLSVETMGQRSTEIVLAGPFLPTYLREEYQNISRELLGHIREVFAERPTTLLRIHGDFHPGNILWTDTGGHLVDLDDCINGPAVQDIWMLLSGERDSVNRQLAEILAGYEEFFDFDHRQLRLIEPLRTLRLLNYAAWLAQRWQDPAFPQAFPWFAGDKYWEEHILTLREQQMRLLEEPVGMGNA